MVLNGLTGETGYQDSLLISQRVGDLKNLRDAIAQLKARTGRSPIARVVELEPWSRIPERRRALLDFDP